MNYLQLNCEDQLVPCYHIYLEVKIMIFFILINLIFMTVHTRTYLKGAPLLFHLVQWQLRSSHNIASKLQQVKDLQED